MSYINSIEKTATISFKKINFETSIEVAQTMRDEIVTFFKENPKGKLEFDFGGYARLSSEFANELFKDGALDDFMSKIVTRHIHLFDELKLSEAMEASKASL